MEREITHNLAFEHYAAIPKMNASTIIQGFKSMLSLRRAIDGEKPEETAAMRLGVGSHKCILEPEEFGDLYAVMPDFGNHPDNRTGTPAKRSTRKTKWSEAMKADWIVVDGKDPDKCPDFTKDPRNHTGGYEPSTSSETKWAKDQRAKFVAQHPGKLFLKQSEYDRIGSMLRSLHTHPTIPGILRDCTKEVTVTGVICHTPYKGRLDLLATDDCIYDLKGTADVRPPIFGALACRLHYPEKMAIYRELVSQNNGGKLLPCKILAAETDGDFDRMLMRIPDAALEHGFGRVSRLTLEYENCLRMGTWPGVDGGLEEVEMHIPSWWMDDPDTEMNWS